MGGWAVENWLDTAPGEAGVEYFEYWNDPQAEFEKPFYVLDGDFSKMEAYLSEVGLPQDLQAGLATLRERGVRLEGRGIDLAAGNLWAAHALLAAGPVEKLYCLEFSRHRLLEIGPRVLEHYGVEEQRVVLCYGSFYELRLPDDHLDFAFLSQAFHHAERPGELLDELGRVLKPGGVAILIGEHVVGVLSYIRWAAKLGISLLIPRRLHERVLGQRMRRTLRPRGEDLVPVDPVLGDHQYKRSEYEELFASHGFAARRVKRPRSQYQGFILENSHPGTPPAPG